MANLVHGLGDTRILTPPQLLPFPLDQLKSPKKARKYFLHQNADVLKKDDLQSRPLKMMVGPTMPFAMHTPRMIPLAFQEPTKKDLESLVTQGILKPLEDDPSEWCYPMVVVPKPNGGFRITSDLSKLNRQVSHSAHLIPTLFTDIRSISQRSGILTTMDVLVVIGIYSGMRMINILHLSLLMDISGIVVAP